MGMLLLGVLRGGSVLLSVTAFLQSLQAVPAGQAACWAAGPVTRRPAAVPGLPRAVGGSGAGAGPGPVSGRCVPQVQPQDQKLNVYHAWLRDNRQQLGVG